MEKVYRVVRYQLDITKTYQNVLKQQLLYFPTKDQAENHINMCKLKDVKNVFNTMDDYIKENQIQLNEKIVNTIWDKIYGQYIKYDVEDIN